MFSLHIKERWGELLIHRPTPRGNGNLCPFPLFLPLSHKIVKEPLHWLSSRTLPLTIGNVKQELLANIKEAGSKAPFKNKQTLSEYALAGFALFTK